MITARADSPARDLLLFQNAISDWKAKASNMRCRQAARKVMLSRYIEVSDMSLNGGRGAYEKGRIG